MTSTNCRPIAIVGGEQSDEADDLHAFRQTTATTAEEENNYMDTKVNKKLIIGTAAAALETCYYEPRAKDCVKRKTN